MAAPATCQRSRSPGDDRLAYAYYGDGTRRSVADGSGTAQYLERDERGRVTRIERPGLPALLHEFDDSGNRTLSRVEGGPATTYAWDGAGRMTAVVDGADGARADYVWDAAGRLETVTYSGCTGPEIVGTYAYQPLSGGLESITWETVETTPRVLLHLAYELDDGLEGLGRRTGVVETWSGGRVRTVGYQFDELYRLTGEDYVEFGSSGQRHIAYTYDDVGNRTRRQVWGNFGSEDITSVHDDNDRLLHAGVVSYAWDPNGNLVSRGGMPLDWDDLDRMTEAGGFEFEYDPDGLKRRTDGPSGDVRHVVDATFPHAQVIEDRSAAGAVAMRYVRGIHPVKLVDAASGKSWWYLHDAIGLTRALVSCTGATPGEVTDEWDYEAFGEVTQHRAFGATGDAAGERNRWLFAGEERRTELGLDYLRARWMEPGAGRFVSLDPLQSRQHDYAYCDSDPVSRTDRGGGFSVAEATAAATIQSVAMEVQTLTGLGIMDTVQYGGDEALKRLVIGTATGAGVMVAVRMVGPFIRRVVAAAQDWIGSVPGRVVVNGLGAAEEGFARDVARRFGGVIEGPPTVNFAGIDGWRTIEGRRFAISLKAKEVAHSPLGVQRSIKDARVKAANAGYDGVHVYVDAREVPVRDMLSWLRSPSSHIDDNLQDGTLDVVHILLRDDSWLTLIGKGG